MTSKGDPIPAELLGTWRQISGVGEDLDTGVKTDTFGEFPNGYAMFSPEGRVMMLSVRSDRHKPSGKIPTRDEAADLYHSMIAYAGTFSLKGDKIHFDLVASWNEIWTGTRQERFWALHDDRLIIRSPEIVDPFNGRRFVHCLVYERVH